MTRMSKRLAVLGLAMALLAFACGDDDDDDAASEEPAAEETTTTQKPAAPEEMAASVEIVTPEDGATVPNPVMITMAAKGFTIEPAGAVKENAGHFHVMVDVGCVEPGMVIPMDATHYHFGKAQTEASLQLPIGEHTLCLQAGDGIHTALHHTDEAKITVQ